MASRSPRSIAYRPSAVWPFAVTGFEIRAKLNQEIQNVINVLRLMAKCSGVWPCSKA